MKPLEKESMLQDLADLFSDMTMLCRDHGVNIDCLDEDEECEIEDSEIEALVIALNDIKKIVADYL